MQNELLVPTSVRLPAKLKDEAETLVKKGYYGNFSDLITAALRDEIKEHKMLSSSVKDVREIRAKIWGDYMKRAGGNSKKAARLMYEEDLKACDGNP
ncbi:MAG: ribbon-helix-helix domain-containing protein, partial [Candidatus Micrarchaeota archaeon]